jgi:hypothetical protein
MNNAKNNKKIIIELTSEYLFEYHNSTIDYIIEHIKKNYQDDQQRNEINKLENDINLIIKLFDDFNPKGTDGTNISKISSFINNYNFKSENSDKFLKYSSTIINHIISDYGKTKEALNKTKKIDEGSSWPFTIFKTSEWQQVAGKFNNMIDQNTQLNNKLINNRIVFKDLLKTQKENSDEIDRLNKEASTNNTRITELEAKQTDLNNQLTLEEIRNKTLQSTNIDQTQTINELRETLVNRQNALDANNKITAEAKAAATAAEADAAVAQAEAEAAQREAAAAQTSAETDKKRASEAEAKAQEAEDAKKHAEAKAEAATKAAEAATKAAEAATKAAEAYKKDADIQLSDLRTTIEEYTKANEELQKNQTLSQEELASIQTKLKEAHAHLKNQTTIHKKALEEQEAIQQQQIKNLTQQHKAVLEAKTQEFKVQKKAIKFISSLSNFAKQKRIEALEAKFIEQENDHKNSIAELENINKKIIGEKDAHIKELTSEVTKLKIDKDGNVKGPLTTITRLFPLAWQNSKGYNIGNIITLVRGDKPYSTTDNVDHYLYNLFQSIQEDTGKTSTDAKKKYDKKYKSSPYQQHVSKNIPINKGYNNNIGGERKSKKRIHPKKSKKHQKHNNTKKQKINKTKK